MVNQSFQKKKKLDINGNPINGLEPPVNPFQPQSIMPTNKPLPSIPPGTERANQGETKKFDIYTQDGKQYVVPRKEAIALMQNQQAKQLPNSIPSGIGGGVVTNPMQQAQQADLQQAQVDTFNTQMPEQRELSPNSYDTGIPILGTMADVSQAVFRGETFDAQGQPQKISPMKLKNDKLTEIEKKIYEQGVDNHTKFGAIVESIPLVGTLVNKYARGLIDTPAGNVNDLRTKITKKRKEIIQLTKDAKLSPSIKMQSEANLDQIEQDIQALESKMSLLVHYSSELRAQPEELDLIEQDVYNTKRYLLSARIAIINNDTLANDEEIMNYE